MRGRGRNFLDNGADACLEGICKRLKFRFTALAGFFVGSGAFNLGLFLCISPVFVALPLMQPVLYFRLAILLLKSFVLDHVHFEYVDRARHITNLIAPSRAWNLDFLIAVHQLVHLATNTIRGRVMTRPSKVSMSNPRTTTTPVVMKLVITSFSTSCVAEVLRM